MMIKKNNKVLVGALALLLVMAVGYALFGETITINGTATAKGEFDIGVSCVEGINSSLGIDLTEMGYPAENGYKKSSCLVNGNSVSYSAELEYPEAIRYFTLKITNNGTMDAIYNMDSGVEMVSDQLCMDGKNGTKNGQIESDECYDLKGEDIKYILAFPTNEYQNFELLAFEDKDHNVLNYFEDDVSKYYDGDNITLKPGESFYAIMYAYCPDMNSDDNSLLATQTITQKFTFNQSLNN